MADYRGTAQMTFHLRFFPATLRAKQLIDAGAVGEVLQFRAAFLHGGSVDPNVPLKWKLTAAAGGGVIADLASHVLDFVEHAAGPLQAVAAATHIAFPERPSLSDPSKKEPVDAEDSVTILARLPSGATGTLEATKLATGSEDEFRFEIHGTKGAVRFNSMEPHWLDFHDAAAPDRPLGGTRGWNRINAGGRYDPPATVFPSPKTATGWLRAHVACLGSFLQAVAAGHPAKPGLQQGVRVQHLMECVRRSAESKRWVEVQALFKS
jgi:predicted dehydrogenase